MGLPGPWVPDFNYQNFDINKKITNVWYHLLCTNVGYSLNVPAVKLFFRFRALL